MTPNRFKRFCSIAEKIVPIKCKEQFKVVAIISKNNKVISTGVNISGKSYPFLKKYFAYATIHAEISALIPIIHYDDMNDLDIFVYRESNEITKKLRKAKPCPMCVSALYDTHLFKNVYWTNNDGTWEEDKIDNLYYNVMKMDYNLRYYCNGNEDRYVKDYLLKKEEKS